MASYMVMEPAADRSGEAAIFVKDAFAPMAVVVPALWLLWNRLWYEAAMALLLTLIAAGAAAWIGAPQLAGIGSILIGLYVALEGGALKIAAARRRGFEDTAVIDARSVTEAEERYFLSRRQETVPSLPVDRHAPAARPAAAPDAGQFALPGSH